MVDFFFSFTSDQSTSRGTSEAHQQPKIRGENIRNEKLGDKRAFTSFLIPHLSFFFLQFICRKENGSGGRKRFMHFFLSVLTISGGTTSNHYYSFINALLFYSYKYPSCKHRVYFYPMRCHLGAGKI